MPPSGSGVPIAGTEPVAVLTIVHLITTLTQGGSERVLSQVVPSPDEHPGERHVVVSLAPGGMFADALRERGVEVRDLDMRPGSGLLGGVRRLAALLVELEADVVIAWLYHAALLATLARPLTRPIGRRPRLVWNLRGSLESTQGVPRSTRAIIRLLARLARRPDAIAINSEAGRRTHMAAGFRPRAWVVVQNGVDTDVFRPDATDRAAVRADLGLSDEHVLVMSVARNHPEKGLDLLGAAALRTTMVEPTVRFVVIGSGTETFDAAGHEVLTLLGERRDVARLLRGSDLLVLSSRTEGLPNAVLEAMATGVPCVVTDVGACREVVGATGMVVASGDVDGLVEAIVELARAGAQQRRELGSAARQRVIEHFGWEESRAVYRSLWA